MDDAFFRKLSETEAEQYRQWARDNWKPDTKPKEVWHPVVREEWAKLNHIKRKPDAFDPATE